MVLTCNLHKKRMDGLMLRGRLEDLRVFIAEGLLGKRFPALCCGCWLPLVEDVCSEILSAPKCGPSHNQRGFVGSVGCSCDTSSPCELGGGEGEVPG